MYEKEHRILLPINDAINNDKSLILLFRIEPKYIKKVILGCRMSEKKRHIFMKSFPAMKFKL